MGFLCDDVNFSFKIEEKKKNILKEFTKKNGLGFDKFIRSIITDETSNYYFIPYFSSYNEVNTDYKIKRTKINKDKNYVVCCLRIERIDKQILMYLSNHENISVSEYVRRLMDNKIKEIENK